MSVRALLVPIIAASCLSLSGAFTQALAASLASSELARIEVYATTTNSYGDWGEMLDRTRDDDGTYSLKDGIKEKGGRLRICVFATWSDGIGYYAYEESWRDLDIVYESSNVKVASVSSAGIVTATGDGTAVITATATDTNNDVTKSATLKIVVAGQSGPLVTEVYVCDEKGKQYEETRLTFADTDGSAYLYFREVYSDGSTASNAPKASDYDLSGLTEYTWSVSDSNVISIGAASGYLTLKTKGNAKAYITVTGGDPDNKLGGSVQSYVWVVIDDGDYSTTGDVPSDSLTVNVVYTDYPDYIVATQHYTIDELKAIETVRSTYTLTCSNGEYATSSGEGIYLTTLFDLIGVDPDQIQHFTFTALDGKNPGKISYSFLFQESYYYPNYEFDGNRVDGVLVFPMLAWESDWRQSSEGATNCGANYSSLNGNTCLRLLFGARTTADNHLDYSLKYISEMNIHIEGAPPAQDGDGDDGGGNGSGGGTDPNAEGNDGSGGTQGDGSGGTGSGDDGNSAGDGSGSLNGVEGVRGNGDDPNADVADSASASEADGTDTVTSGKPISMSDLNEELDQDLTPSNEHRVSANTRSVAAAIKAKSEGGASDGASGASQRWHAYQMMNPEDPAFEIEELQDNAFLWMAPLVAVLVLLVAAARKWLGFRRRLRWN